MARSRSHSIRDNGTGPSAAATTHKSLYNTSSNVGNMSINDTSPPRRRMTRSQSREVEANGSEGGGVGHNVGGGRQRRGKGEKARLEAIEESPADIQRRVSSTVARESPEDVDAVNMSGTTILPSEPETDLDPDMMIESLPSLEREAKGVLNILVPGSVDLVSIVNTAKKLRDPQNAQSKRLKRFTSNLDAEAQYFGHQTYIDTKQVNQLVTSALAKKGDGATSKDWSPDPILHKANCARLALEVLLAESPSQGQKSDSQRKAINGLERRFPSPFLNGLGKERQDGRGGHSYLEKETFDLALEIRTQSLLMKLQMHEDDNKFDPEAIINRAFFVDDMEGSYPDNQTPLRGFDIGPFQDENGYLPERFAEAVHDRIDEIRVTLAEDDGAGNIRGLQGAYGWQKFVLRVAQWIRKRDSEISRELQSQPDAEDVRDDYSRDEVQRQGPSTSPRVSTIVTESSVQMQKVPVKFSPEPVPAARSPSKRPERRKSNKNPWVQSSVLQRLKQRSLQSAEPRTRRQTDFVRPVTPEIENGNRRQTLPPRTPVIAVPESREIPASPEGSPTLLQDDEDIFADAESLQPRRNGDFAPERSHSPPMRRQTSVPRERLFPSSEEVWNAAMRAITPRPNLDARRKTPAAFVDRQEHAQRVSPISEAGPSTIEPSQQPSRKRAFEEDDDDDDDDDEFTRYERAIDPSIKRAQKPDPQQHRVQKRRRIDDNGLPATAPQRGNTPPLGSARPASPPSPQPRPQPQPQPSRASDASWRDTSTFTDLKMRVRWSEEEDRRLIRLIRECGPHWAALVRHNYAQPVQAGEVRIEDRDSVQYKDRARNLKILYYREGRQNELPGQFRQVTMSKRDILSLQKRGIEID